ncbi:hypothetical protein BSKO_05321 [Bryopsis sp. KO-2023]|nr:hypothetical protein BSKO_05321 [Bryopsis sp. KO-2023]
MSCRRCENPTHPFFLSFNNFRSLFFFPMVLAHRSREPYTRLNKNQTKPEFSLFEGKNVACFGANNWTDQTHLKKTFFFLFFFLFFFSFFFSHSCFSLPTKL